jgi:cysteine protease ATG4
MVWSLNCGTSLMVSGFCDMVDKPPQMNVFSKLINDFKPGNMVCYIGVDGAIYKEDVSRLCQEAAKDNHPSRKDYPNPIWKSVLILLPLRLGVDFINPIYLSALKACFILPQTVGIAGGKANSSLYFIGHEGRIVSYMYKLVFI